MSNLPDEKYFTVVFRLSGDAGELIKACDQVKGATVAAMGWGHALEKIDELELELQA